MIRRAQRSHHQRDNIASIAAIGIYGAAMHVAVLRAAAPAIVF